MLHVLIIRGLLMYLLHIIYSFDFPLSLPRIYICDIVTGQKYGKKRIYRVAIRSAACLLRRFSSLSFCLQITPRCIRIVFQSSTIYTRRDHVCFSHGIRGSSTTFQSPTIAPYLLQVRTISAFFSLFLFLFLFYFFFFYFFYAFINFFAKLNGKHSDCSNARVRYKRVGIFNKRRAGRRSCVYSILTSTQRTPYIPPPPSPFIVPKKNSAGSFLG